MTAVISRSLVYIRSLPVPAGYRAGSMLSTASGLHRAANIRLLGAQVHTLRGSIYMQTSPLSTAGEGRTRCPSVIYIGTLEGQYPCVSRVDK